jgi:23S rRNA (cytidine1920-2'-O)/16S rRNA (cytidine1409-2'-O)-methyltransferase
MAKERLDVLLHQRGLCASRELAKRLVLAGEVMAGTDVLTKPGMMVDVTVDLTVKTPPKYVGRGGLKMEGALEHYGLDVTGRVCLDIGASTGGFTDCLLQHGAAKVYAFDVGTNQLAWKIRSDARVISREGFNVRHLQPEDVPEPLDLIVADVSFISLTLVLPPTLPLLRAGGDAVVLVKPQFELSREEIGTGGIVREPELHEKACQKIRQFIEATPGVRWAGLMDSPIKGTDGTREFLAWIKREADA